VPLTPCLTSHQISINFQVELGAHGVEKIHPIGKINAYEQSVLEAMKKELADSVTKGVDFVKNN
jgi:malate dehydrogenase